ERFIDMVYGSGEVGEQVAGKNCAVGGQTRIRCAVETADRLGACSKSGVRRKAWIAEAARQSVSELETALEGMLAMKPTQVVSDRVHWTHVAAPPSKSPIRDESGPQRRDGMERYAVGERDELQRFLAGRVRAVCWWVLKIDRPSSSSANLIQ